MSDKRKDSSNDAPVSEAPEKPDLNESRPQTTGGSKPVEIGGRDGPDPVRYGDWEKGGRCIDF